MDKFTEKEYLKALVDGKERLSGQGGSDDQMG